MNFIKKFFKKLKEGNKDFIFIKLKCSKCGEILNIRINKLYELEQDFDEGGYILNKEAMDSKCFKIIKVRGKFDNFKNLKEITAEGGEIIEVD
jgi:hypothetical protein